MKLRKNNWDADTYEFDEVLTEFASQKRVYEVVAKPVVEVFYVKYSFSASIEPAQDDSCLSQIFIEHLDTLILIIVQTYDD